MTDRIVQALVVLLGVPAVLGGYIWGVERLMGLLPERRRPKVRPWFWN